MSEAYIHIPEGESVDEADRSDLSNHVGKAALSFIPTNEREKALKDISEATFEEQLVYMNKPLFLTEPLIAEEELSILNEPEIYSDDLEDTIIAQNAACQRALALVKKSPSENTTAILRAIRNTVASQIFKKSYDPEDPLWTNIAARVDNKISSTVVRF